MKHTQPNVPLLLSLQNHGQRCTEVLGNIQLYARMNDFQGISSVFITAACSLAECTPCHQRDTTSQAVSLRIRLLGSQALLGGYSNVLEALRSEGVPPPACRAVMFGGLRYLDAELLNALMLRRDCCSTSAVRALKVTPSSLAPSLEWLSNLPSTLGEFARK